MEKRSKKIKIQLPDSILSLIFSKLGLKDLVKTSALSKLWRHEWKLRTDLNFDLFNMFDNNKVQELPKPLPLLQGFQSEFTTRLDQFMLHYQGDMIDSIRVNCPLSYEYSDVIERLISKGIAKGAKRIELLLAYQTRFCWELKACKFSIDILSGTDTLTYLHLQNCYPKSPFQFSRLKNLRTLVLQVVFVGQNDLESIFSNCINLVDFTLDNCQFNSDLQIIGPTLFRLNIINCQVKTERNIHIIASNLSSIEYSCNGNSVHRLNIEARMLSKFSFRGWELYNHVGFSGLKNVTTIVIDGLSEIRQPTNIVSLLFSECLQLEDVTFMHWKRIDDMNINSPNLRHLKIIECGNTQRRIDINALNLASFEYNGNTTRNISVTAPMLSRVYWNAVKRGKNPHPFGPITTLQHIENLAMFITTSQVAKLTELLVQYQNLRQLELFILGSYDPNMDYFWILDIAMASQHLQKLSLTIRNLHLENSHMVGFKRQRKEYAGFSHNNLKYVELHGCVCSTNVFEFVSCLLKNANSLKQITFGSLDKFYIGAGRWSNDSNGCCWFERNLIHEKLKDEVHEQCQLIIF